MRLPVAILAAAICLPACKGDRSKSEGSKAVSGSGQPATNPGVTPHPTDDGQPTFRLDDRAMPTGYAVSLSIDPASETFAGKIAIQLEVKDKTNILWMHGRELDIESAILTIGGKKIEATTETRPNSLLGFRFGETLEPGAATLDVIYKGRIVRRDGSGIFAEKEGDDWYQYTQFESLDARRAFPCFDEPRWKTPWKLTLEVEKDLVAVANTPIEKEEVKGVKKVVSFVETKALPTYLVAFAVGPFEFVDAGKTKNGTAMRIVVPKGRAAEAAYAAKVTGPILERLESYFGRPYPYRKLDTLIIPTTQGFGAMEHPGLVTFASRLALWKKSQETFKRQRRFALVQAHELGHQWFGNLVTMPWWDDIWLNEAFASWIENTVLDDWRPAWKLEAVAMANKEYAMHADSLNTARQIREPVKDEDGVESAFDGITYLKGESVLNMFETYVGPDKWQQAIRDYLAKFEWKTATASDFLAAVSESSGTPIAAPFNTFLEQNGLPLVKMTLRCAEKAAPVLELAQSRYLPLGSKASSARTWQIPICVTHSGGEACTLLTEKKGELSLGNKGAPCPGWINPNKSGVGYYRADIGRELREAIRKPRVKLSIAERLSFIGDLDALTHSGATNIDEALAAIERLAKDPNPIIGLAAVKLAFSVSTMIDPDDRPNYGQFLVKHFSPAVKRIGWQPRRGESAHTAELRPQLLRLYGGLGEHRETVVMATNRAFAWLAGKEVIAPEMLGETLALAARNDETELLDKLAERAMTDNRIERRDVLYAIGHSRFGVTKRALALTLSEKIDGRDAFTIIRTAAVWPETRITTLRFVMKNYDQLAERLSESQLARLPGELSSLCVLPARRKMAAFFTEKSAKLPGGITELKQAVEAIDLCIATRVRQGDAATFLLTPK